MAFALVFATLHLTAHDVRDGDDPANQHNECQVCRLNQVAKDVPLVPSFVVSFVGVIIDFASQDTTLLAERFLRRAGARGPPHTD